MKYHKINSVYKRHTEGPNKGRMKVGEFSEPEFEYLFDNDWNWRAKVDGTNIRIIFDNNSLRFAGRTDRAQLHQSLIEHLEATFTLDKLLEYFDIGNSTVVTLFGEGVGDKIRGSGRYGLGYNFVLFDVHFESQGESIWLRDDDVQSLAVKMDIPYAPVVNVGSLRDAIEAVSTGIPFNIGGGIIRRGRNGILSQWGDFEEEGLVLTPSVPMLDRRGQRIITKVKAVDFKP